MTRRKSEPSSYIHKIKHSDKLNTIGGVFVMAKRKTNEEFISQFLEKGNENVVLLSKYVVSTVKIHCKCNICGYEWRALPDNLLKGQGCKQCANNKMAQARSKTTEQFIKELYKINPNIEVIGKYANNKTKIEIRCKLHNHIWEAQPSNLLNGTGCPICGEERRIRKQTKSHTQFVDEIKQINPKIKVVGKYKGNKKPIKCKCKIDNTIFYPLPSNLLKGQGCPTCGEKSRTDKRRLTQEEFESRVKTVLPNIEILGKYITQNEKIKVKCKIDGTIWMAKGNHLLNGHGCPACSESKGEKMIRKYLRKKHIKYRSQYKMAKCKNERSLPFDFAIFDNSKLIALMEYQGIQHYKPIEYFGGEKMFKYQRENDNIKRNYCKINDIPLIEIPYTVDNIEGYLDKQLSELDKSIQLALTK